jgi:hypothetical protein
MNYNLIEELSKEFKSKVKFRHLSLQNSDDKPKLEFVPRLR